MPFIKHINYYIFFILILILVGPSLGFLFNIKFIDYGEFLKVIYQLKNPLFNTFYIAFWVVIFSLILGSSLFWLINFHVFSGVKFFKYLIFLPILIPIYINGFAYAYFFEYNSILQKIFSFFGRQDNFFNIRSEEGAIFVFTLNLYPYVYILIYSVFKKIENSVVLSRICGYFSLQIYLNVFFNSLRPILIFCVSIIFLEVMADYGLAKQYGLNNLSNFLYQKWFFHHQYNYASMASLLIIVLVAFFLLIEQKQRKKIKFNVNNNVFQNGFNQSSKFILKKYKNYLAVLYCSLVLFFSFVLPIWQLLSMVAPDWRQYLLRWFYLEQYLSLTLNSILIAFLVSLMIIVIAFLVNIFFIKYHYFKVKNSILKIFITLAYGLPGAFVAIAILIFINKLLSMLSMSLGQTMHWVFFSTIFGMVYGLCFRFLNLGIYTINANLMIQNKEISWCKKIYGGEHVWQKIKIFFWCLPLYLPSLLVVFLIVMIDVMKELPISLILRPFNFNNLIIKSFELISDELYEQAALYGLLIIALLSVLSILLVYITNKVYFFKQKV